MLNKMTTAMAVAAFAFAAPAAVAQTTQKIQTSTQSGGNSFDYLNNN